MTKYFFSILLSYLIVRTSGQYTCDPTNDCSTASAGTRVPDAEDCSAYYLCLGNGDATPSSIACDEGFFDTSVGDCVDKIRCEEDFCENTGGSTANTCIIDCSLSDASNIPVPGDCTKFYECSDPSQIAQDCPTGTYFNGNSCTDDETQCCSVCNPTCIAEYELVADPQNCNNYVLCLPGTDSAILECPDGEYFNVIIKDCEAETVPCNSYCPVDAISTSTTIETTTTISSSTIDSTISSSSSTTDSTISSSSSTTDSTISSSSSTTESTISSPSTSTDSTISSSSSSTESTISSPSTSTDSTISSSSSSTESTISSPSTSTDSTISSSSSTTDSTTSSPSSTTDSSISSSSSTTDSTMSSSSSTTDSTVSSSSSTTDSTVSSSSSTTESTISTPSTTTETTTSTETTTNLIGLCYDDFVCPVDFGEYVYCDACISQHYDCSTGIATLEDCPTGQVFDYTISDCVSTAQCPTFGGVDTTPTTFIPSTPTVSPSLCSLDFVCPVDFGEYVYCDACISQHYDCSTGIATLEDCPTGQVFDYTISDCVPTAQCPTFGGVDVTTTTFIPSIPTVSPSSCYIDFVCPVNFGEYVYCDACITLHYDCNTGAAVLEECGTGEVFDYTISDCVPTAQCPTFG